MPLRFTTEELDHLRTFGAQLHPRNRGAYLEQVAMMLRSLGREHGPGDVHRSGACRGVDRHEEGQAGRGRGHRRTSVGSSSCHGPKCLGLLSVIDDARGRA
jgi:hypothetical protein